MRHVLRRVIAALFGRPTPLFGRLADERKGEFFTWFNLVERGAPSPERDGHVRHYFHPSGPAFQRLVKFDLSVAADDTIVAAQLSLDRDFVEDARNSAFARDISKSFLAWSLLHEP